MQPSVLEPACLKRSRERERGGGIERRRRGGRDVGEDRHFVDTAPHGGLCVSACVSVCVCVSVYLRGHRCVHLSRWREIFFATISEVLLCKAFRRSNQSRGAWPGSPVPPPNPILGDAGSTSVLCHQAIQTAVCRLNVMVTAKQRRSVYKTYRAHYR